MGQVPQDSMLLIQNVEEAKNLHLESNEEIAYVTQTTLSLDETSEIIETLKIRYPKIIGPSKKDICYATTNRQEAIKLIAKKCDSLIILGSSNSSNAKRLVEVGIKEGCRNSFLINNKDNIPWERLKNMKTLGLSSGASSPEILVEEVIDDMTKRYDVNLEEIAVANETITFNLPRTL